MWEYKLLSNPTEAELNTNGQQGWEAVGLSYGDWNISGDVSGEKGDITGDIKTEGGSTTVLLKRPIGAALS